MEEAKSSAKQTWKILNQVLNKRSSNRKISCNFKLDNKELTDPKSIAEQFCKYFFALANNISATSVSHRFFFVWQFLRIIILDSVSEQEVIENCKSLKSGTAIGYDNVSVDLVKQCAQLISSP